MGEQTGNNPSASEWLSIDPWIAYRLHGDPPTVDAFVFYGQVTSDMLRKVSTERMRALPPEDSPAHPMFRRIIKGPWHQVAPPTQEQLMRAHFPKPGDHGADDPRRTFIDFAAGEGPQHMSDYPRFLSLADAGDDLYWRVAGTYAWRLHMGDRPTQAIAKLAQVSHSTAARWVGEARRRGFIPPTTKGKA